MATGTDACCIRPFFLGDPDGLAQGIFLAALAPPSLIWHLAVCHIKTVSPQNRREKEFDLISREFF